MKNRDNKKTQRWVICAIRPKSGTGMHFIDTLAYGEERDHWPDRLLRDRGATMFKNEKQAMEALNISLAKEEKDGSTWMKLYTFELVQVREYTDLD